MGNIGQGNIGLGYSFEIVQLMSKYGLDARYAAINTTPKFDLVTGHLLEIDDTGNI